MHVSAKKELSPPLQISFSPTVLSATAGWTNQSNAFIVAYICIHGNGIVQGEKNMPTHTISVSSSSISRPPQQQCRREATKNMPPSAEHTTHSYTGHRERRPSVYRQTIPIFSSSSCMGGRRRAKKKRIKERRVIVSRIGGGGGLFDLHALFPHFIAREAFVFLFLLFSALDGCSTFVRGRGACERIHGLVRGISLLALR